MFEAEIVRGLECGTSRESVAAEVGFATSNAAFDWARAYIFQELDGDWGRGEMRLSVVVSPKKGAAAAPANQTNR